MSVGRMRALGLGLFATLAACGGERPDMATAIAGHAATSNRGYHSKGELDIADYRDCNHNAFDGRETDVRTSQAHCGACDAPCDGHCERGICVEQADAGTADAALVAPATAD